MTRLVSLMAASVVTIAGCTETPSKRRTANRPPPSEDFTYDTTVLIASPMNGVGVPSPLTVTLETGSAIERVSLLANGSPAAESIISGPGTTDLVVELPTGRYTLSAQGFDSAGELVSSHGITVRIITSTTEPEPWVLVTSPRDDSMVTNPVAFTVEANQSVDTVELFADDWSIGSLEPGEVLRYTFSGTDYPREIDAVGYDNGVEVARDALTITPTESSAPGESNVNDIILTQLSSYPTDGSYAYWWPDDSYGWFGNPHDIYYQGSLYAEGDHLNRSYCVGITLQVFMDTFDILDGIYGLDGSLNGVTWDDLDELRKDWFVRDLYGSGIVEAMENYGIGSRVSDWDDVRPGDIIQFWRHSGSGHNAIFIGWERDDAGEIYGFTYWSTQNSTDGIGYSDEYFGTSGSRVDPNYFFVGRVAPPEDWTPWY
ncbi:MAG: hypothetical protein CL927_05590 [Deltaproteobacteria bacterium]|nr:hypothetical protein [Deltaproteobacteria bacterium]